MQTGPEDRADRGDCPVFAWLLLIRILGHSPDWFSALELLQEAAAALSFLPTADVVQSDLAQEVGTPAPYSRCSWQYWNGCCAALGQLLD